MITSTYVIKKSVTTQSSNQLYTDMPDRKQRAKAGRGRGGRGRDGRGRAGRGRAERGRAGRRGEVRTARKIIKTYLKKSK